MKCWLDYTSHRKQVDYHNATLVKSERNFKSYNSSPNVSTFLSGVFMWGDFKLLEMSPFRRTLTNLRQLVSVQKESCNSFRSSLMKTIERSVLNVNSF